MIKQRYWLHVLLTIVAVCGGVSTWSFYLGLVDEHNIEAGDERPSLECLRKGVGCGQLHDTSTHSENRHRTDTPPENKILTIGADDAVAGWSQPTLPTPRDGSVPCPDRYLTVNTHTWGRHHNQLQSVVHALLTAHMLKRTFILGHFRHAKAWHDVRDFYSFTELSKYFCITDEASVSGKLQHEKSVGCFGQDVHDMPLGKHLHLHCNPTALFPKSFPIPGFKTVIRNVVPKLAAAQQRIVNLSGELAFFLRPGLELMAVGYGLLQPSKQVGEEVDKFAAATFGGREYIAVHLRYREGTCAAEIETDFVQNFNITPKLLGGLHAQCKVNTTYVVATLRDNLGITSAGDPNLLPYPSFLASDHQNKAAEQDLLTKGAVFYTGRYHTEEIGGLHGLATDYFLLRRGHIFIGNSASSVSQNTCFARLLTQPWKRACTGWDLALFREMTDTAAASLIRAELP